MDKTLQLQLQIRQNADEISSALTEIKGWEKSIKAKDKRIDLKQQKRASVRSGGGTVPLKPSSIAPDIQSGSLTPASLVNKSISQDQLSQKLNTNLVPKAMGTYQEKDLEEIERERGNSEFKMGNFHSAVKSYTKCLGLKKNNFVAFSNRAMAYLKLKEYHRALMDCSCALSIEPSHVKSLLRRANALNAMGKHRAALKDLLLAQKIEGNNKQVKQDVSQTRELLRNAVNRAPLVTVESFASLSYQMAAQQPLLDSKISPVVEAVAEPETLQGPDFPSDGTNLSDSFTGITEDLQQEETRREEEVSLQQVKIKIVEETEEEASTIADSDLTVVPSSSSKKSKKSPESNSMGKKAAKAKSSVSFRSSYELESLLVAHQASKGMDSNVLEEFLLSPKGRKEVLQVMKSCYEPTTLAVILRVLLAMKKDLDERGEQKNGQKLILSYCRGFCELSNFDMLYSLLSSEERLTIYQEIVSIKSASQLSDWDGLLRRFE